MPERQALGKRGFSRPTAARALFVALLLVGASRPAPTVAQQIWFDEPERWVHFTAGSGLPGGTVHALAETPTAVWVATDEGFFWFDEFRWQRALPDAGTPLPIVPSWIAPDLRGGVLAVQDGQLYRGDESGLTPVRGVVTFARRAVPLDSSAVLVLGTPVEGGPADLFVIRNGIVGATSTPGDVPGGFEGPEQLWRTDAGRVWLNSSQGLSYWDGDGWVVAHPALAPGQSLLALWENEDGQRFAAFRHPSSIRGLWQWRGSGPLTRVRSEGEEHLVNLLGTGPDGAVIAFHETGHVRAFVDGVWTAVDPLPRELRGATFLTSRPNGDSWLGTPEGLSLYVRSFNRWSLRQYPFNDVRNWTNELLPAPDGSLWIGTRGGVVHQREGQDDVWYREAAGRPVGAVNRPGRGRAGPHLGLRRRLDRRGATVGRHRLESPDQGPTGGRHPHPPTRLRRRGTNLDDGAGGLRGRSGPLRVRRRGGVDLGARGLSHGKEGIQFRQGIGRYRMGGHAGSTQPVAR